MLWVSTLAVGMALLKRKTRFLEAASIVCVKPQKANETHKKPTPGI